MLWDPSVMLVTTFSTGELSDLISLYLNFLEMEIQCQAKVLLLLKYYRAGVGFQISGG